MGLTLFLPHVNFSKRSQCYVTGLQDCTRTLLQKHRFCRYRPPQFVSNRSSSGRTVVGPNFGVSRFAHGRILVKYSNSKNLLDIFSSLKLCKKETFNIQLQNCIIMQRKSKQTKNYRNCIITTFLRTVWYLDGPCHHSQYNPGFD